jgi:heme A synthase
MEDRLSRKTTSPGVKLALIITFLAVAALAIGVLTSVADIPLLVGALVVGGVVVVALAFALPLLAARSRR